MAQRQPHELRPIMTRLPERLRAQLERSASDAGCSMNSEIIRRLQGSYAMEKERGLEYRIEQKMDLVFQQVIETLGPKLDALLESRK